jgi:hypothetical protein
MQIFKRRPGHLVFYSLEKRASNLTLIPKANLVKSSFDSEDNYGTSRKMTKEEYFLYFFLDTSPHPRLKALDPIRAYKVAVRIMV